MAANFGPISVISYASDDFKNYSGGIYDGSGCDYYNAPNHASLLYGYDLTADVPYLLFKNNWGTEWGINGYYKVKIGKLDNTNKGVCLIADTKFNTMPLL